jgi:hypothetical protein
MNQHASKEQKGIIMLTAAPTGKMAPTVSTLDAKSIHCIFLRVARATFTSSTEKIKPMQTNQLTLQIPRDG